MEMRTIISIISLLFVTLQHRDSSMGGGERKVERTGLNGSEVGDIIPCPLPWCGCGTGVLGPA